MTTTTFVNGSTPIIADWLNDVDAHVYDQEIVAHDSSKIAYTQTTADIDTNISDALDTVLHTSNYTTLQAALNAAESTGKFLFGDSTTDTTITSTLSIKCSCDLSSLTLTVDATVVTTAIRVGPNSAGNYLFDKDIKLPRITNSAKVGAGWTGFSSSIGIEIANVYQSRILVPYVYNFGVGLTCGGYGVGCVYNDITVGVLFGNKVNVQLLPKTTGGWCNQNTFTIQRLGYSSAEGTAVSGVKHIELRHQVGATTAAPNNNVFINPSVEGNEPEFHLDIQGTFNTFINPRLEISGVPARVNYHAVSANETAGNNIIGGYDSTDITYTFSGAGTSTKNKRIGGTGNDSLEYSGNGINITNKSSSAISAPHIQGFESGQTMLGKTAASTDWIYRLYGGGIAVKGSANAHPRVELTSSGVLLLGSGSVAADAYLSGAAGTINSNATLRPLTDNAFNSGGPSNRWNTVYSINQKTSAVTVANLPAAATIGAGGKAFVSDANATTFASIVAGGGANNVPVYSDGTNWRIG